MKACSGCHLPKSDEEFDRDATKADGLHTRCKECRSKYNRRRYEDPVFAEACKLASKAQAWWRKFPERHRVKARRNTLARKARKLNQFVEEVDPLVLYARDEGLCGICETTVYGEFHVDHRIPLAKGGEHSYANTQIAHPECNLVKGAK